MPWLKALPTWLAVNNCNFSSPTGLTDPNTGQPYTGGALNVGDFFPMTNEEAANASYTTNGNLFEGQYRFVQVDSSATAANVKTGTVGYLKNGSTMKTVVILTAGSGQTDGSYNVSANAGVGGGTGAIINVIIAGGLITAVSVVNPGYGYVTPPTFTVAEGGTPGTVIAQLDSNVNVITSADQALAGFGPGAVRPVVFLNAITPGNYGFVQELGTATVLATASQSQTANQFAIVKSSGPDGTMTASSATFGAYAIGKVIDPLVSPLANTPFKILLNGPVQG